jgi:septal ring factor EnvC (AmiA/AmiB activator)
MPTDPLDRARTLIQSRLAELAAEAKDLERALASLGERHAPRRRPGRPKRATTPAKAKLASTRKRKSAKRAPRGQRRDELLAALKVNPGARPSDLARQIGISSNQVHVLIAKARKDKLLVKKSKGYALRS